MFVYLDNSATTRQHIKVTALMVQMMEQNFGNPSSLHHMGITAEKALKLARRQVADSLSAGENEIIFTAGGTESDNTAIFGAYEARKKQGNKIITSKVEHPAVLEACRRLAQRGAEIVYLDADACGTVDLAQLERELDANTILITVMHVNNELGTIEPLSEIGRIRRAAEKKFGTEILFHVDAVQSYGKENIDIAGWGADMLSVSGHKIHGPKGAGALYVRSGLTIPPFLCGGGQERGMRSGTENMPAIAGFGLAAEMAAQSRDETRARLAELKAHLEAELRRQTADIRINSPESNACPSILNVSFPGCRGEVLLHMLEQKEIYVSTGSACSSKKKGSHVLAAAGLAPEVIEGAVRFSLSADNTKEELSYAAAEAAAAAASQRALRSAFSGRKKQPRA